MCGSYCNNIPGAKNSGWNVQSHGDEFTDRKEKLADAIRRELQGGTCHPQHYALFSDLGKAEFGNVDGTRSLRARELWSGPTTYYLAKSKKERAVGGAGEGVLLAPYRLRQALRWFCGFILLMPALE